MFLGAGPNFEGCDLDGRPSGDFCNETVYGCCPDGETPAQGANYDGCPRGKLGPLFSYNHRNYGKCRPIIIQKIHELVNFHYVLEVSHGRSNMKFTFNHFFLSEPEITPVGICQKKEERGPCSDFEVKWFYNTTSQRCDRFWYGGCEGNDNRFDDEEACSRRCKQTTPDTGIKWLSTKFDGSFEIIPIGLNDLSTFENH